MVSATVDPTYEQLRARVMSELTVPERFNFVTDTFEKWRSDRLAIVWLDDSGNEKRFTWDRDRKSVV